MAQLQAAIKGDEAQINTARLNLGYADIRSPIDGRLGARLVDAGNMVRATDAAGLVTISPAEADLRQLYAAAGQHSTRSASTRRQGAARGAGL